MKKLLLLTLTLPLIAQSKMKVAITIDDLPFTSPVVMDIGKKVEYVELMTSSLKKDNVRVYGFTNNLRGIGLEAAVIMSTWMASNQYLSNHTTNHPSPKDVTASEYSKQIEKMHEQIKSQPNFAPYFRYPYLNEGPTSKYHEEVSTTLKKLGYRKAPVTIDFWDWAYNEAYVRCKDQEDKDFIKMMYKVRLESEIKAARARSKSLLGRDMNHVLLLHMNQITSEMMGELLVILANSDMEVASLEEVMEDEFYSKDYFIKGSESSDLTKALELEGKDAYHENFPMNLLRSMCND